MPYTRGTRLPLLAQRPAAGLPLDGIASLAAVWDMHRLRTAYTGPALRLRRGSDDAESDFGFLGNDLDTAAVTAWLGGATGYVRTWYDQSGNARHAEQATTSRQPQYAAAVQNGKPGLFFPNGTHALATPSYAHFPAKRGALAMVARWTGSGTAVVLTTQFQTGTTLGFYVATSSQPLKWYDGGSHRLAASYDTANTTQTHTIVRTGNTTVEYYRDGVQLATPVTTADNQPTDNPLYIGATSGFGDGLVGYLFGAAEFGAAITAAERQALEAAQRSYYGLA